MWGPIRTDGLGGLKKFSDAELETLRRFFEDHCEIQRTRAMRIRGLKKRHRAPPDRVLQHPGGRIVATVLISSPL
jgi:hypothetical protein